MTLAEAVDQLDRLPRDGVLYVERPWGPGSTCLVRSANASREGSLAYFLEVVVAKEVLEVFHGGPPSRDEKMALLLYYAENDAYPDWVYSR